MSYIRRGHPLRYFGGNSTSYIFPRDTGNIEDYDDKYEDNATFAELIVNIILRETKDEEYAWKIAGILADKLKIKRRPKKLTAEEYFKLARKEEQK